MQRTGLYPHCGVLEFRSHRLTFLLVLLSAPAQPAKAPRGRKGRGRAADEAPPAEAALGEDATKEPAEPAAEPTEPALCSRRGKQQQQKDEAQAAAEAAEPSTAGGVGLLHCELVPLVCCWHWEWPTSFVFLKQPDNDAEASHLHLCHASSCTGEETAAEPPRLTQRASRRGKKAATIDQADGQESHADRPAGGPAWRPTSPAGMLGASGCRADAFVPLGYEVPSGTPPSPMCGCRDGAARGRCGGA